MTTTRGRRQRRERSAVVEAQRPRIRSELSSQRRDPANERDCSTWRRRTNPNPPKKPRLRPAEPAAEPAGQAARPASRRAEAAAGKPPPRKPPAKPAAEPSQAAPPRSRQARAKPRRQEAAPPRAQATADGGGRQHRPGARRPRLHRRGPALGSPRRGQEHRPARPARSPSAAASSPRTSCSRPWPSSTASRSSTSRRSSRRPRRCTLVPETMASVYKVLPLTLQGQRADRRHRRPEQPAGAGRPAQLARRQRGAGACWPRPQAIDEAHRQVSTPARKRASSTSSRRSRGRSRAGQRARRDQHRPRQT